MVETFLSSSPAVLDEMDVLFPMTVQYCLATFIGASPRDSTCQFYHKETYLTWTELVVFKRSFPQQNWKKSMEIVNIYSRGNLWGISFVANRSPVPRVPFYWPLTKWLNKKYLGTLWRPEIPPQIPSTFCNGQIQSLLRSCCVVS